MVIDNMKKLGLNDPNKNKFLQKDNCLTWKVIKYHQVQKSWVVKQTQ